MQKITLYLFVTCALFINRYSYSQSFQQQVPAKVHSNFLVQPFTPAFVENHGQFNRFSNASTMPEFGSKLGNSIVLFRNNSIEFIQLVPEKEETENESDREESREFICKRQTLTFIGSNSNAIFFPSEKESRYYSYLNESGNATITADGFQSLVLKDLYPGIDVTFTYPQEGGLKYSFTINPGADPDQITMKWSGVRGLTLDESGNVVMNSENGNYSDKAPVSFYAGNQSEKISSTYSISHNRISIQVGNYDHAKPLIIDPWIINPNFTFNSAYDINHDAAGNIYVYGGANPYVLQKYDSSGAPVWVFNTFAGGYYGDFTLDPSGYIYIIYGPWTNQCLKLDSAAGIVFNVVNPVNSGSIETYRIQLNPVTQKMVIIGMELINGLTPMAETLDTLNGSYSVYFHHPTCISGEARSLAVDGNGDVFALVFSAGGGTPTDNLVWKMNANLNTLASVIDGYLLYETEPSNTDSDYSGYNGMAVGSDALYTYDGQVVKKWNKSTLALIDSVVIAGGMHYQTGGLCADSCGNVYVGGPNSVLMFDSTLTLVTSAPTPGAVYDVAFGNRPDEILACGSGFAGSFNFPACNLFPLALFFAPNHICPGTCTDFVNLSSYGQTFLWQFPGATPSVSTDFSPTNICYNTPGNYSVTLIVSNTVGTDTLSLNNFITVYPYPAPQGISQIGDTLFANPGAVTYQWYFAGSPIAGATDYYYVASNSGNFNVVATDVNGCEVEAAIFDVIASVTENFEKLIPIVTPNPASGQLILHFPNQLKPGKQIRAFNALGEIVYAEIIEAQKFTNQSAAITMRVDISNLPPAVYYLEFDYSGVSGKTELYRTSFIKQ